MSISPESFDEYEPERSFAWLTAPGVYHGKLLTSPPNSDLGAHVLSISKLFSTNLLPNSDGPVKSIALTHHHVLILTETTLYAINRLDDSIVFQQTLVDSGTPVLGLCSDPKKSTFWVFTPAEIHEVVVTDEERDLWKILLEDGSFDKAMRYAKTNSQKDQVAVKQGDHLAANGRYIEAAEVWGKSSKSFEEVALMFLEKGEQDALRKYLLTKLMNLKKNVSTEYTTIINQFS
jgi:vacuolar protein sorting-associated protein 18